MKFSHTTQRRAAALIACLALPALAACEVPGTNIPVDPPTPAPTSQPNPAPTGAPGNPTPTPTPTRTPTPTPTTVPGAKPIAIVYGGPGVLTGRDDTLELAHTVAHEAGFETIEVTSPVKEDVLNRASIWIQPGGPNLAADRYMNGNGMADQVRDFVKRGGGFVGFCGGAFSAMNNLELIPGSAWGYGAATKKLPITWLGTVRYLHYEHGPYISLAKNSGAEVVGTYANGAAAAVRSHYGKGAVFITGPHPEASATWPPVADPDGTDHDLAVSMILEVAHLPDAN